MSNTNTNFEMTGILLGQEVRKRKTPQEKIAIIQQTMEPGMNVSHVARLHGIQPGLYWQRRRRHLRAMTISVCPAHTASGCRSPGACPRVSLPERRSQASA